MNFIFKMLVEPYANEADDPVLNDTKKRSRLSPQLFAIRQSLEASLF